MLYSALIFGFISSLHCVGMCGPIALMIPVDKDNTVKKWLQISTYQIGRVTAYTSLGVVFGFLGAGFFLAGIQQQLSIAVGVMMILIAIIPEKKLAQYNFSKPIYKIISEVKTQLGLQFKKKSYKSLFLIGLFNGYLPCGMVYVALFGAMAMNNVFLGSLYMTLFGLGTIPLMMVLVNFLKTTQFSYYSKFQKVIPILIICIGILFVLRGFGLDIPYISPSILHLHIQSEVNCH
ncbi:sulfite exporter TauE/SafE family protein [Flavobacterium sp. F372]|jgi:sulfite exporter TauE/SafE|uniref:Sulfite exporter TauE/SafE family protein n=1 Tax=Flavobacterium bernardetii TaxID=2813823 RepID=A0ABR7IX60_9FLAO|nr:sulfite exporter TauE/SafE family protein [Flavobacterium bernardetii]MBC5834374.1 sulfite exporter TauE/SafE family protein [Flavobacterium bernardetii]NHF69987.1 sulfite exporter TauE/SafE family protein [Flavobacterium bernardetii]